MSLCKYCKRRLLVAKIGGEEFRKQDAIARFCEYCDRISAKNG